MNENEKFNKKKYQHNKNKFHFNHSNEDYGLDERITIRPFHIKYDSSFKKLTSNRTTPSKMLGEHSLSSGVKEAINRTHKIIPKIDYSYTDPQYYEHNLKNKTNKDFILDELSPNPNGRDFAKKYVAGLQKRPEGFANEIKLRADAYGEMKDLNGNQTINIDDTPTKPYSYPKSLSNGKFFVAKEDIRPDSNFDQHLQSESHSQKI
jgi:hypothetical protein